MLRRAKRLALYQRAGTIRYTPETENYIRKAEGLPEIDEDNPPELTPSATANAPKQKDTSGTGKTKDIKGSSSTKENKKDNDDA